MSFLSFFPLVLHVSSFWAVPASRAAEPLSAEAAIQFTIPVVPPHLENPAATLTWKQCVQIAKENGQNLLAALRAEEASRASYLGTYNGLMPTLNLADRYNKVQGLSGFSYSQGFVGNYHIQATASGGMNIFNYSTFANIWSGKAGWLSAAGNRRLASVTLRYNLRLAFANLIYAQLAVDINKMIMGVWRQNYDMIKLRYDSGKESKGNMLTIYGLYLQARAGYYGALRNLRMSQKVMDQWLGLDDFKAVAVTGTYAASYPEKSLPADMHALVMQRPDVAVQEAAVKTAKASLSSARAGLMPQVSVSYNYSGLSNGLFKYPVTNWSLLGAVSYPLFSGGPTSVFYQIRSAKKGVDSADEQLRYVVNAAMSDIETSWATYAGYLDQLVAALSLLQAYRQRNEEADILYQSGSMIFNIWYPLVQNRLNQELTALGAERNVMTGYANWERSLGRELEAP